jgi:UDP-N-acetylglucosamine 2-epimerase (non-hydrolysing)
MKTFGLTLPDCLKLIEPVGFYDFLLLESNAALVLTDSGGVQEECCILRVPCVTLRDDTERPETLQVGSNVLSGRVPVDLLEHVGQMLARPRTWSNPFGEGDAARRMVDILLQASKSELLSVN